MAPTEIPTEGLPTDAQHVEKSFIPGSGENETKQWSGTAENCESKYNVLVQQAKLGGIPGNNIREVRFTNDNGRGVIIAQFARKNDETVSGIPGDMVVVEELYGVDIVRDIRAAPYFCTGGTGAVTDDNAVVVTKAADLKLKEAEITLANCGLAWASWTDGMKQLRYHLLHGNESYYETGFILRRSMQGLITSQLKQTFSDLNKVVAAPTFKSDMDNLIYALPEGEWLHKPPQVEYVGGGKWNVQEEWHWAEKWSVVYGGTWKLT